MILIRFKRAMSLTNTDQNNTYHIERRNNHSAESYDKSSFGIRHYIRIVLTVLYGKETKRIT